MPLNYQEMAAWSKITEIKLSAWEADVIRNLSMVYLNELSLADDPKRLSPCHKRYNGETVTDIVINQIDSMFGKLKR